jgi:hypothetical protein
MFIFVNYSNRVELNPFHGAVIAIDSDDVYAPFPSLFIIHEMRVRGFHPFQPVQPSNIPDNLTFVDWIDAEDLWDADKGCCNREKPPREGSARKNENGPTFKVRGRKRALGVERQRHCRNSYCYARHAVVEGQLKNTSWEGTAEENIQKYVSSIGVEDH